MQEVTYDVPGVSCDHCVRSITKATTEIGAKEVQVDLASKKVFVAFDPTTVSEAAVKAAIEDEGYDVADQTEGNTLVGAGVKKTLNLKSV